MSRKILIVVLLILCAALLIQCTAPDSGVTEPVNQIQPRESFPEDQLPAQPGEGPAGLPTPGL